MVFGDGRFVSYGPKISVAVWRPVHELLEEVRQRTDGATRPGIGRLAIAKFLSGVTEPLESFQQAGTTPFPDVFEIQLRYPGYDLKSQSMGQAFRIDTPVETYRWVREAIRRGLVGGESVAVRTMIAYEMPEIARMTPHELSASAADLDVILSKERRLRED